MAHLAELDFERLSRWDAEMRAAMAILELRQAVLARLTEKIDPQGLLAQGQKTVAEARHAFSQAKSQYLTLAQDVGRRMDLDMSKYAYDDLTGELRLLPEE